MRLSLLSALLNNLSSTRPRQLINTISARVIESADSSGCFDAG
jgi:hypothetical protein